MHTSEQQLLRDCLKNRPAAQEALYKQFAAEMLGVCYRYTKSLDDAEDVLQDGFVKVFTQLHTFRNEGALRAWIRKIMVRTALSYLRQHSRYRNQMQLDASAVHPVIEETATMHLQTEALIDLIRKLPLGYQTIFNLVGIEGYSHQEVAIMLNINENTSRSQYSRARAQLMRWMAEEAGYPKSQVAQSN